MARVLVAMSGGVDSSVAAALLHEQGDEVVADYDERALISSLPALPDPAAAARSVYDAVAGFGPLQRHLDDPTVEEIWVNEPGRVFVARRGRSELTTGWANHASSSSRPVSVMA